MSLDLTQAVDDITQKKREIKAADKLLNKFRPHAFENTATLHLADNYRTMMNLSFLDQSVVTSNVGSRLNIPQAAARPGRPVTIQLTYQDLLNVDNWEDDSKLIFKKVQMNAGE